MLIPRHNQDSRGRRWAYAGGRTIKRAYRKLKAFEMHLAEGATARGIPAGKLLVHGGFLAAKLAVVGVLLFISFWLFVFVCTVSALVFIQPGRDGVTSDIDDSDGPTHRTSWPERYDEWGSLK
ncbi:DUF3742 family protein [Pseudomonas mediterranea]|uniref:DUF3742 family protein n=1 Tax=Pseudomonas mediterranea TaxID=183795 RepID=UPI0025B6C11B|nr:DUF3742 family protein [Pseudomonas mediterranea]